MDLCKKLIRATQALALLCFFVPMMAVAQDKDTTINIPLGGNAWVRPGAQAVITNDGLEKWSTAKDTAAVYVRVEDVGKFNVALNLWLPSGKSSTVAIKYLHQTLVKTITSNGVIQVVDFGKINVAAAGYLKFELIGLAKASNVFANVFDLVLSGPNLNRAAYVHDNHGNYFHWGRRGPSVHLKYQVPAKEPIEWFYNEVTVPTSKDIVGSYFMVDGFSDGYFGMQVNSPTERRVLFSVWSPFKTDDPKTIPDNMKIVMLKKGETVHAGEFGSEGSGGQSYLIYPWTAGKTYCFLIHAQGDIAAETTIYTAYFKPKDATDWQLIASFKRPQSGSYLEHLHSFVENFEPDYGDQTREAFFGNQWALNLDGKWNPISAASFSYDETARMNYRKDYSGKSDANGFYLKNGGFFNEFTVFKTRFTTDTLKAKTPPHIDFKKLP